MLQKRQPRFKFRLFFSHEIYYDIIIAYIIVYGSEMRMENSEGDECVSKI